MKSTSPRARWTSAAALLGTATLVATTVAPMNASAQADRTAERHRHTNGTVTGVMDHLIEFEQIADDNGGNRAAGLPGYKASRDYIVRKLKRSNYKPKVQSFDFPFFQQLGPSTFTRTAPEPATTYEEETDYALMTYSAAGDVTAPVQGVDAASADSGCEEADFVGFTAGHIALIRRGTCDFAVKAANAETAGAVAAIIFNQGNTPERTGVVQGTLGGPVGIPVLGTTTAIGESLLAPGTEANLKADTISDIRKTWNVTAQTRGARNNVVMAGAHLDSVPEGEGINDNGSGSAALLEVAEKMADRKKKPNNRVRFAWWGAEELGLLGSEEYVARMAENSPGKFQNIALYLNFDMVGSPNYMLGVYDGNNSKFGEEEGAAIGPDGSAAIERNFHRFFDRYGSNSVQTPFSGRSDYGPFIALNVPAGGLFTGAEGIKSVEEAALFGGTAGVAYDPCYHADCDDLGNLSRKALKANTAAIWQSVKKFSRSTRSVNGKRTGHEVPPPAAPRARHAEHRHAGDPVAR